MLKKIINIFLNFLNLQINKKNYYLNSHFLSKKKIHPKIIDQILSRNFPVPRTHKLLISFNRIGTEKYVTKIYKKI